MKIHPIKNTEFCIENTNLGFDLLLTQDGSFALGVHCLRENIISLELGKDTKPTPTQELKLAFIAEDGRDFIAAMRNLLKQADAGT